MSEEMESEVDLEQDKGEEPASGEDSVVEDEDDENGEVIPQDEDEEEELADNNEEEEEENALPSPKDKSKPTPQSKPKEPPKTETKKQQSIPLNAHASSSARKEPQARTRSGLITEANLGEKSIFTKITESIFQSYLNTEEGHKPKAYDYLISENYLTRIKDQDDKSNKDKFNDMLDRQQKYQETVSHKQKQRQERQQEELKSKCTWTPNGLKQDMKVRNPGDFYTDQLRFLEEKKSRIQKKKEDLDAKEDKDITEVPAISRNSKAIAKVKHPNETEEDFVRRLKNEKLKVVKEKIIEKEGQQTKTPQPKPNKKSLNEMNELVTKLHAENEKNQKTLNGERMKKMAEEAKRENNLITDSTKKIFLDKLINTYERALLELFNRKENFAIDYESYCLLMSKIGFTLHFIPNAPEETTAMKAEEELLKESFMKYLNVNDERIDTHSCLLFFLGIIGIYKGKGYHTIQQEESQKTNEDPNNKKANEEDKKPNKNKRTPEEFIHKYIPELDLENYHYSISAINVIKTRFRLFYNNISAVWIQEINNKRKEKKAKAINLIASSSLDKPNDLEAKTSTKSASFKESTRKKIIDKASKEVDPNRSKALKIEEVYDLLQKKKENELVSLRTQKEKEDMKECTFQPNALTKKVSKDISANIEKLYTDGKVTYQKKLQSEDYKKTIENRELEQCTFRPDIHSMNESLKRNPLDKDAQLKKELERREQARNERDYLTYQKKKGLTFMGNTDLGASNDRNRETVPSMRFDIEKKTFKDTFNTFETRNKANAFNSTISPQRAEKERPSPLLNIEVNIDDNNQIVKLEIYPGDDPIKIAEDFCLKHGLSNDKKEKLQRIIQEKLAEVIGDSKSLSQA